MGRDCEGDMKYPKRWIEAIIGARIEVKDSYGCGCLEERDILNRLHVAGALKDPPKPREWWICPQCDYVETYDLGVTWSCVKCNERPSGIRMIHVREVEEE